MYQTLATLFSMNTILLNQILTFQESKLNLNASYTGRVESVLINTL